MSKETLSTPNLSGQDYQQSEIRDTPPVHHTHNAGEQALGVQRDGITQISTVDGVVASAYRGSESLTSSPLKMFFNPITFISGECIFKEYCQDCKKEKDLQDKCQCYKKAKVAEK